jgi:hypothetical protein
LFSEGDLSGNKDFAFSENWGSGKNFKLKFCKVYFDKNAWASNLLTGKRQLLTVDKSRE